VRNYKINLRGTEKDHAREARDLIAHAKKLLRQGTCSSVTSAMIASAEAHAHAVYVAEGHLDWQAWEVQSAARDKLGKMSCYIDSRPSSSVRAPAMKRVAGLGAPRPKRRRSKPRRKG